MLKYKFKELFNICQYNYIALFAWIIFIVFAFGFWQFQQYLIEGIFFRYKILKFAFPFLVIIVCVLPYIIYRKFKIKVGYYSLAFYPSIAIMAITTQESFNYFCIIMTIIVSAIFVVLIVKQPNRQTKPEISNIYIFTSLLLYCWIASNTNELTHYKYKISHYIETKKYDKALNVGKLSLNVDSVVFNLRTKAMLLNNSLGNDLFLYPIPDGTKSITINYKIDQRRKKDAILCNLLLQKKLSAFANMLSKVYDLKSPTLPKYYKEALVLYLTKTIDTELNYQDATVETNYNDFIAEMKKHSNIIVRKNTCRDLYSDTYFWYYFFK